MAPPRVVEALRHRVDRPAAGCGPPSRRCRRGRGRRSTWPSTSSSRAPRAPIEEDRERPPGHFAIHVIGTPPSSDPERLGGEAGGRRVRRGEARLLLPSAAPRAAGDAAAVTRRPPRARPARSGPGPRPRPPGVEEAGGLRGRAVGDGAALGQQAVRRQAEGGQPLGLLARPGVGDVGSRLGVELDAEVRAVGEGRGARGRAGDLGRAGRDREDVPVEPEPGPGRDERGVVRVNVGPPHLAARGPAHRRAQRGGQGLAAEAQAEHGDVVGHGAAQQRDLLADPAGPPPAGECREPSEATKARPRTSAGSGSRSAWCTTKGRPRARSQRSSRSGGPVAPCWSTSPGRPVVRRSLDRISLGA